MDGVFGFIVDSIIWVTDIVWWIMKILFYVVLMELFGIHSVLAIFIVRTKSRLSKMEGNK